jgi:protocatechuate 4,5-dioxygenase, alpha chain
MRAVTNRRYRRSLRRLYVQSHKALQGGHVTNGKSDNDEIPGTIIFDGERAMRGYALNKMCFSFNSAENREAYRRDEDAYCDKFNLTLEQRFALKRRNVLRLLEAGANIYYLAKWAGIFGLNVQQIGAQQRGMTESEFKDMLVRAGGD